MRAAGTIHGKAPSPVAAANSQRRDGQILVGEESDERGVARVVVHEHVPEKARVPGRRRARTSRRQRTSERRGPPAAARRETGRSRPASASAAASAASGPTRPSGSLATDGQTQRGAAEQRPGAPAVEPAQQQAGEAPLDASPGTASRGARSGRRRRRGRTTGARRRRGARRAGPSRRAPSQRGGRQRPAPRPPPARAGPSTRTRPPDGEGGRLQQIEERRLVEVADAVEAEGEPVARPPRLAGDLGVLALAGIVEGRRRRARAAAGPAPAPRRRGRRPPRRARRSAHAACEPTRRRGRRRQRRRSRGGVVAAIGWHEDDGRAPLAGLRAQLVQDHAGVAVVEVAGGLVGEQERRAIEHGAAVGDPLLLAPRELGGVVAPPMRDPQPLHEGHRPPARPRGGPGPRSARRAARCPARSGRRGGGRTGTRSRCACRARGTGRAGPGGSRARASNQISPASAGSSRPRRLSRVDLPEPDSPITASTCPGLASRSTPSSTRTGGAPSTPG